MSNIRTYLKSLTKLLSYDLFRHINLPKSYIRIISKPLKWRTEDKDGGRITYSSQYSIIIGYHQKALKVLNWQ